MKQLFIAAGLVCCAVSHSVEARTLDVAYIDSPLKIHAEPAPAASRGIATRLQLDRSKFENIGRGQFLFMNDFPLDENRKVTLQLEEASALASNATLVVMRHDSQGRLIEEEMEWPNTLVFQGTVVGEPTSDVFLAIGEEIVNGWITVDGTRFVIGTRFSDKLTLLFDESNVPEGMMNWSQHECGVTLTKEDIERATSAQGGDREEGEECPQAKIAIDTDFAFTDALFEGSEVAAADYVNTLVSSVAGIYKTSITDPLGKGINLKIQYLRLWSVNDDPWTASSTAGQLPEFINYWNSQMGGIDRHLTHLLIAGFSDGGLAQLWALCRDGYAVSSGMRGTFPMPLDDEQDDNWDPIVFAHETGHNFGMIHTHDDLWPYLEPTIDDDNPDQCGNDDCANASGAPIMSYCHLCDGGIANIAMEFNDDNAERAELYLQAISCDFYPDDPPTLADDHALTDMVTPVQVKVLANDIANDCNTLSITDFDPIGVRGGRIEQISGAVLQYTPTGTIAGSDSFTYTARDGSNNSASANVVIEITRPPTGGGGGGGVDPGEVIFVITLWGTRTADCTGDGTTDIDDLLAVLAGKARFQEAILPRSRK